MKTYKVLTDSVIKASKAKEKPYKLSDSGRLYVLVSATGSKHWKWNYRLDGKDCTYTLGEYPDVGLAKARELRDSARKLVDQGVHPLQHKKDVLSQQAKELATTFWGVSKEWIQLKTPSWSAYYAQQVNTVMCRYVRDQ